VLVSFEGETKVIDFGIAKSALRGTATDPKMGFGKFGYMAPEQLIRGGIVDHRTDIYAAGVVLFELLTGKRLYEAGPEPDYRALAKKVAKGDHMMPSDVAQELAPYDDLVATALRPKAEDRYQSAAEFRDSIQQNLVSVNPTISTDQLGSYMRDLFSEEMTGQRELHERVAKVHLEDFKNELTTQTGTTVSFAFANLPLQAPPDAVPAPPVLPRTRTPSIPPRPRPPTAPTDMMPQQSPPMQTGAIATQELGLADGTGELPDLIAEPTLAPPQSVKRRRTTIALAMGMSALVAGVVVFAMSRGGKDVAAQPPPLAKVDPPHRVTVESLPPEVPDPPSTTGSATGSSATPIANVATPPDQDIKIDATPTAHPQAKIHGKKHEQKKQTTAEITPKAGLTRDAVASKMSAVKREYDAYKSKNGGRLDGDWGDLAMFVQFHMNDSTLDEAARRIDQFRAKLHE
jgi:hypothetical protein